MSGDIMLHDRSGTQAALEDLRGEGLGLVTLIPR